MSQWVRAGVAQGRWSPLGIVGPGAGSAPEGAGSTVPTGAQGAPRRFVVPTPQAGVGGATGETVAAMRRLAREGGLLLGAERTALFLFGEEGEPVRRVVRFHLERRGFDPPAGHPAALAEEVRRLLTSVSRVAVSDLIEHPPPPGAMRDYLEQEAVRSLLSLPLRDEDGMIGGFISFEQVSGPRAWSDEDRHRALEVVHRLEELLRPGRRPESPPSGEPEGRPAAEVRSAARVLSAWLAPP